MNQNSLEKAHENISNVIYQAVLNPHFDKEMIVQACEAAKQNALLVYALVLPIYQLHVKD